MDNSLWIQIWKMKTAQIAGFSVLLIVLFALMVIKDRITRNRKLFNVIRYAMLLVVFVYAGLYLKAQPTTTNIVIIFNQLKSGKFSLGLYLLEPFIFLTFVFIFLTLLIWGRGVFCGWLCPYGVMLEILNKIKNTITKKGRFEPKWSVHNVLLYPKYIIFFIILIVSFFSFMLSEYLTEVEPFRTFVLKMHRQWYFNLYFILLVIVSVITYRAFCRYLCPLGAALALPSFVRVVPFVKLKRYQLCGTCKVCQKQCPYNAIRPDGKIRNSECLYCLECQLNYWDEKVCPALKKKKKDILNKPVVVVAFLVIFSLITHGVWAKTLEVGNQYKTIASALKAASPGDTVLVEGGVYRETLIIDKPVILKGKGYPKITAKNGNIITVSASDVVIQGFEFGYENTKGLSRTDSVIYVEKGSNRVTIKDNNMIDVMFGIWNIEGEDLLIESNNIKGIEELDREQRGNCINLTGTVRARVINNKLDYCRDGIYMEVCHDSEVMENLIKHSRYSIHTMWVDRGRFNRNRAFGNLVGFAIMYTKHSEIKGNLAAGNQTHGLLLLQAVRTDVKDNVLIGNTKGLFIYNSILNRISSNLIMNNQVGVHNWGGSEENTFVGNSIINNEIQVKFVSTRNQYWDGNYWSDYLGWDMTGDGVGDVPYESNTVVDHILWRYPILKVLYTSASLQMLWFMEKQFPILDVPKIIDRKPSMRAFHEDWRMLAKKFPYTPERYYGDIKKLPHLPGGVF